MRNRGSSFRRYMSQAASELRSAARSKLVFDGTVPAGANNYLLPHERSVISLRQHPAVLIGPGVLVLAGLAAVAILANVIPHDKQAFVLAAWIAWFILILRFAIRVTNWASAFFVISSIRMLLVAGLFYRTIHTIPISTVTDMAVQRSFIGRLLGYGNLIVQYGGLDQKVQRFEYIPYADEFYLMVTEAIFSDIEIDPNAPRASCPLCNGEGTIFRRATPSSEVNSQAGGDLPVNDLPQSRDDLMTRGYVGAVCPTCDGEGTVRRERP